MTIGISQVESLDLTSLSTSATDLRSGSGTLGAQAAAVINQLGSLDTNWDGESRTAAEIETRDRAGDLEERAQRWSRAADILDTSAEQVGLLKSELVATVKDPFLSSIFTFADDGAVSVSPAHLARLAATYADDPEGYRQAKLSAENSAAQLQNKMQTLLRSIDVATQMYDWQVENALLGVSDAQRPFVPRVPPRPPKPAGQYTDANKAGAGPDDYNSKDVPFLEGPDLQIMRQSLKILLATADTPVSEDLLDHYFGNSGKPYEMNVDAIYRDVPGFGAHATRSAEAAAAEARTYIPVGYTGPVAFATDYGSTVGDQEQTYQISKDENFDYWGALHNISYATTGVSYSSPDGGETLDYQTSVYDYYNFEPGTDIFPPLDITDQRFINNYHLYGWAQNYDVTGTSSTRHSTGG